MKNLLRTVVMAILVLGICLGIWKATGGDPTSFFDGILGLIYVAINAVADLFGNLFGAFFG